MNHKLHICLLLCYAVPSSYQFQLFSRNLRQQGHHYLEHQKTYDALGVDDFQRCGGLIGCGLINITESGKRKRSRDNMDRFLLKRRDNLPYDGNIERGDNLPYDNNSPSENVDVPHISRSDRLPRKQLTNYQRQLLNEILQRLIRTNVLK